MLSTRGGPFLAVFAALIADSVIAVTFEAWSPSCPPIFRDCSFDRRGLGAHPVWIFPMAIEVTVEVAVGNPSGCTPPARHDQNAIIGSMPAPQEAR